MFFCVPFTNHEDWDVSNVKNMTNMFYDCEMFDQYLGDWKLSCVVDMESIFRGCLRLSDVEYWDWDLSNVIRKGDMFYKTSIAHNLPEWAKEES